MTLVPNIRINVGAPFPSLVTGGNGIGVTKSNGVWTIALTPGSIQSIIQTLGIVPVTVGFGSINFGTFPGASDATLVITGQTNIISGSSVEAWIYPQATADHSLDEHWADPPFVYAGNIVPGTGFTIYGVQDEIGDVLTYGAWSVAWRWQ